MKKINKITPECKRHKLKSKELSYMAWFKYADEQTKKGLKQTKCPICKRYYFPDEF